MVCDKCNAVTSNKLAKRCPRKNCGGTLIPHRTKQFTTIDRKKPETL